MRKIVSRYDSAKILKEIDAADLRGADLEGADLRYADLRGADLGEANLRRADLRYADLRGADLEGANLEGANFGEADLRYARYSILAALRLQWNDLSSSITLELMRWGALSCGTEKMTAWAKGGKSPFDKLERDFYFQEKKELWKPGKPKMNHVQLWRALCKECKVKIDE